MSPTEQLRGIRAAIYRRSGPAHPAGTLQHADTVTVVLVCEDGPVRPMKVHSQLTNATDRAPAVRLVATWVKEHKDYVRHFEPCDPDGQPLPVAFTMGGTFVHSADWRFHAIVGTDTAIPLHDVPGDSPDMRSGFTRVSAPPAPLSAHSGYAPLPVTARPAEVNAAAGPAPLSQVYCPSLAEDCDLTSAPVAAIQAAAKACQHNRAHHSGLPIATTRPALRKLVGAAERAR